MCVLIVVFSFNMSIIVSSVCVSLRVYVCTWSFAGEAEQGEVGGVLAPPTFTITP